MINYYPTLIRHWLGFPVIGLVGSSVSNFLLTPWDMHIPGEVFLALGSSILFPFASFNVHAAESIFFAKVKKTRAVRKALTIFQMRPALDVCVHV